MHFVHGYNSAIILIFFALLELWLVQH